MTVFSKLLITSCILNGIFLCLDDIPVDVTWKERLFKNIKSDIWKKVEDLNLKCVFPTSLISGLALLTSIVYGNAQKPIDISKISNMPPPPTLKMLVSAVQTLYQTRPESDHSIWSTIRFLKTVFTTILTIILKPLIFTLTQSTQSLTGLVRHLVVWTRNLIRVVGELGVVEIISISKSRLPLSTIVLKLFKAVLAIPSLLLQGWRHVWRHQVVTSTQPAQKLLLCFFTAFVSWQTAKFAWRARDCTREYFDMDNKAYLRDALEYQMPSRLWFSVWMGIYELLFSPTIIGLDRLEPWVQPVTNSTSNSTQRLGNNLTDNAFNSHMTIPYRTCNPDGSYVYNINNKALVNDVAVGIMTERANPLPHNPHPDSHHSHSLFANNTNTLNGGATEGLPHTEPLNYALHSHSLVNPSSSTSVSLSSSDFLSVRSSECTLSLPSSYHPFELALQRIKLQNQHDRHNFNPLLSPSASANTNTNTNTSTNSHTNKNTDKNIVTGTGVGVNTGVNAGINTGVSVNVVPASPLTLPTLTNSSLPTLINTSTAPPTSTSISTLSKLRQHQHQHQVKTDREESGSNPVPRPLSPLTLPRGKSIRPLLFVGNHAILGGDMAPLQWALGRYLNLYLRGVAHKGHFNFPGWSHLMRWIGGVPGTRDMCRELMKTGWSLLVYPGGGREVMKKTDDDQYTLMWGTRTGFASIALENNAVIIPVASVGFNETMNHVDDLGLEKIYGYYKDVPAVNKMSEQHRRDLELRLIESLCDHTGVSEAAKSSIVRDYKLNASECHMGVRESARGEPSEGGDVLTELPSKMTSKMTQKEQELLDQEIVKTMLGAGDYNSTYYEEAKEATPMELSESEEDKEKQNGIIEAEETATQSVTQSDLSPVKDLQITDALHLSSLASFSATSTVASPNHQFPSHSLLRSSTDHQTNTNSKTKNSKNSNTDTNTDTANKNRSKPSGWQSPYSDGQAFSSSRRRLASNRNPLCSSDLRVSVPLLLPPSPAQWQRWYFKIGNPIDTAVYMGNSEEACLHVRDRVVEELENTILELKERQALDPDRYTWNRWYRRLQRVFQ